MAGLQNYVLGNQPPPSAQPPRTDRLIYAANAKVSTRKRIVPPPSTFQQFQTVVRPFEQPSIPAAPRHPYAIPQYAPPQQPASTIRGTFDDTLSLVDDTESTVGIDEKQDIQVAGNNRLGGVEYDYDEVETLGDDSEFVSERPTTPRGRGISGRFHQPQGQQQHANMELRPNPNSDSKEQLRIFQKHSRDRASSHQERGQIAAAVPSNFDTSSSGEESSDIQNGQYGGGRKPDYDDEQLEGMTYKDLKDETWESEKHGRDTNLSKELQDTAIPLSDRFQTCVSLNSQEAHDVQVEFFASMSSAEWEEAGDLFIGRFAEIITKLKNARQAKRKVAMDFEKLIEEREALIRAKSESLDADFAEMKRGGEGVIRGKLI